ncbi:hypothetical protein A1D22_00565 [Pasteurellaceae bacterium LFhippo2]|nr:hypothetical protein [Pasteurellaceae bacterium LFhippo2]
MNLLLLTFGERLENHYQSTFCILSFLKDPLINKVIVVTDRPEFYQFFNDKIEIITINADTLNEWKKPYDFFWKIKIKAVEMVIDKYPEQHLLYVDSDTFLATNLAKIHSELEQGNSLMHICESPLSAIGSKTLRNMYNSLNGKSFAGIAINEKSEMWNAGVIALPSSKAKDIIQLTIQSCDEMCATDCTRRLIEQFAFSISTKHLTPLKSCETTIGHYWGNKEEWNLAISRFLVNNQLKAKTVDEYIEDLKEYDWNAIPLEKKKRNTAEKLKKVVDKLFPIKKIRYFIN